MTEHFTFFESYYQSIKELSPEIKAEFYDVLFNYALYDDDTSSDASPIVRAIFLMAKPNLDKSKARREAGKQGGSKQQAKPKQKEANLSKPKQTPSDKDKDKDKEEDKEKEQPLIPADIIRAYKANVSEDRAKIDESWTMKELRTKKHDYQEIIKGLINYGKKVKGSENIQKLSNFISNRIYLDYQEEKKEAVMNGLLYQGSIYG